MTRVSPVSIQRTELLQEKVTDGRGKSQPRALNRVCAAIRLPAPRQRTHVPYSSRVYVSLGRNNIEMFSSHGTFLIMNR